MYKLKCSNLYINIIQQLICKLINIHYIIFLLDPDPDSDPAGSEKVWSVTSLTNIIEYHWITLQSQ